MHLYLRDLCVILFLAQKFLLLPSVSHISFARWESHEGEIFHLFLFLFGVVPIMSHKSVLVHGNIQHRAPMV